MEEEKVGEGMSRREKISGSGSQTGALKGASPGTFSYSLFPNPTLFFPTLLFPPLFFPTLLSLFLPFYYFLSLSHFPLLCVFNEGPWAS